MNRSLLGNILIITFLVLTISGLLMYFTPFTKNIASLHTFFALLFILAIILHIINNKKPLYNYITGKRLSKLKKFQSPLLFIAFSLIASGLYFNIPFFNKLYSFGNQIRNEQLGKTEQSFNYQTIELDKTIGNYDVSVELKKGAAFQYPLFAIWIEDASGNYIKTLYISKVLSSSTYAYGKKVDQQWESAIVRRPEALPYWAHKRGIQASDGLYIPLNGAPDLDAVSGATPTDNFIITSRNNFNPHNDYKVLIEFNQSFDWNEYYTSNKFPNDKIYSGSGKVGQPSLIYAANINTKNLKSTIQEIMTLIGHGHHSGKNGKLYKDTSQITTAKNIAERIIVTIKKKKDK